MPDPLQPRTALNQFLAAPRRSPRPANPGLELFERPFLGQLNLRGEPEDARFLQAVEQTLGISLPVRPNTFVENDRATILWLSPNEWLLITSPGQETYIARQLGVTLKGIFSAVNDVTHNQSVIRIRGRHVLDVLRKGCSLDLHPAVFGPGHCAQTLLAKAGIVIRWVDLSPAFEVVVRRSFTEYVALWLEDAAEEYGFAIG